MALPAMLPEVDVKASLTLVHSLYWFLITNASAVRRKGGRTNTPKTDGNATAKERFTTDKASPALVSTVVTYIMYYFIFLIWWFKPEWAGALIIPISLPVQLLGLGLLIIALSVKIWAFWTFRSWRLFPQVDPGHQLVTSGPYNWVRHPLYFAFQLLYLGSFLMVPRLGFLIQFVANFLTHNFRCKVEESVLTDAFKESYEKYKQSTNRLIPGIY